MNKKQQKFLVVRLSSIGDIVLTTPVIRCLAQQLGAEVHFLTKGAFAGLLSGNPSITKVWTLSADFGALIRELKAEGFDYIIDLHKNLRSLRLSFALNTRRLTYDKTTFEKFLMVHFKINRLPRLHVVDRYMHAVQSLGVVNDGKGLDFFIGPDTAYLLEGVTQPFVCAVIGATHFTKRLPGENWIRYINRSKELIVLIGGEAEIPAADNIVARTGDNVINMVGRTSLQESALILKHSERVITNDTGMLHIAAALRKPIVSLWGGTVKEYGFWPYYPEGMDLNHSLEIEYLKCRPCSKFGRDSCPKGHFRCMRDIEIKI